MSIQIEHSNPSALEASAMDTKTLSAICERCGQRFVMVIVQEGCLKSAGDMLTVLGYVVAQVGGKARWNGDQRLTWCSYCVGASGDEAQP